MACARLPQPAPSSFCVLACDSEGARTAREAFADPARPRRDPEDARRSAPPRILRKHVVVPATPARPTGPQRLLSSARARRRRADQRPAHEARAACPSRVPWTDGGRELPHPPDGPARLLRARVGQRGAVLAEDPALLPRAPRLLVGGREHLLGVARHERRDGRPRVDARARRTGRTSSRASGARSASRPSTSRPRQARSAAGRSRSSPPTSASDAKGASLQGLPCGPGACSSEEERRPSKPRVGGSNPSRRTSLLFSGHLLKRRLRPLFREIAAPMLAGRVDPDHPAPNRRPGDRHVRPVGGTRIRFCFGPS